MVKLFHDFHLSFDTFAPIWLHQFYFLVDFDSYLLVEHLVQTQTNDCIGTLTDALADEIIIQVFYCTIRGVELDHILIWLPVTLIDLSFIQRMSIIDFACLVLVSQNNSCRWFGLIHNFMDGSGFDLTRLYHDCLIIAIMVIVDKSFKTVLNSTLILFLYILSSIEIVRANNVEVARDSSLSLRFGVIRI
jgi:hypothetical protein